MIVILCAGGAELLDKNLLVQDLVRRGEQDFLKEGKMKQNYSTSVCYSLHRIGIAIRIKSLPSLRMWSRKLFKAVFVGNWRGG